jgi:hypothetical protein
MIDRPVYRDDDLLTQKEVAFLRRVSVLSIYRARHDKKNPLPYIPGNPVMIRYGAYREWLQRQEKTACPVPPAYPTCPTSPMPTDAMKSTGTNPPQNAGGKPDLNAYQQAQEMLRRRAASLRTSSSGSRRLTR